MLADVAEECHQVQRAQPFRVIHEFRGRRTLVEVEKSLELRALAVHVLRDGGLVEQGTLGTSAARVADQTGATAQYDERLAASPLEVRQQHEGNQVAYLQARCGGVEPHVPGHWSRSEPLAQAGRVVLDQTAPGELFEEVFHRVAA